MGAPRNDERHVYHCESPGCVRDRGLKLALVVGADGSRSYHWFCELHCEAQR